MWPNASATGWIQPVIHLKNGKKIVKGVCKLCCNNLKHETTVHNIVDTAKPVQKELN